MATAVLKTIFFCRKKLKHFVSKQRRHRRIWMLWDEWISIFWILISHRVYSRTFKLLWNSLYFVTIETMSMKERRILHAIYWESENHQFDNIEATNRLKVNRHFFAESVAFVFLSTQNVMLCYTFNGLMIKF